MSGHEVVPVALRAVRHAAIGPVARVRGQGERHPPASAHLGVRDGDLRAGRVLPIRVVVATDQARRAQDGERQRAATLGQLVLGQVVEQQRDAARIDPSVRGVGGQRLLVVAALAGHAALDDGELPLGMADLGAPWKGRDKAHPVILGAVVEGDRHAQERIVGAELQLGHQLGRLDGVDACRPIRQRRRGPGVRP